MKTFNIGDTIYWVEAHSTYGKQIPCDMCFGKKFVTIILGDDSKQEIECSHCQNGLERPSGFTITWGPEAKVRHGLITGVSTRDGIRYEVGNDFIWHHEVIDNEESAEKIRVLRLEEVTKKAETWHRDNFIACQKKQLWSAMYHRNRIKDAERTIAWHRMRLNMIKDKSLFKNSFLP